MNHQHAIEKLLQARGISVREKAERLADGFKQMPDLGVMAATELALTTRDVRVASFLAVHLSHIPHHRTEKEQIVAHLLSTGPGCYVAASHLIRFVSDDLIDRVVDVYFANPQADGIDSLLYEVAVYFPHKLHAHARQIEDPRLRTAMLAGGPDAWVAEHAQEYGKTRASIMLEMLGRIHTPSAVQALMKLHPLVPADEHAQRHWRACLELAGSFADGSARSTYLPAFEGFVMQAGCAPHPMGGVVEGHIPICPRCQAPAARIVTLSASELPYGLASNQNPIFFWFDCACNVLSATVVQVKSQDMNVLIGPGESASSGTRLLPEARSLVLVAHPNPAGMGSNSTGGAGRHQVGGVSPWIRIEPLPLCPLCRAPMRFLVSIDGGMTALGRIDFEGQLYGFWCDTCAVSIMERQAV